MREVWGNIKQVLGSVLQRSFQVHNTNKMAQTKHFQVQPNEFSTKPITDCCTLFVLWTKNAIEAQCLNWMGILLEATVIFTKVGYYLKTRTRRNIYSLTILHIDYTVIPRKNKFLGLLSLPSPVKYSFIYFHATKLRIHKNKTICSFSLSSNEIIWIEVRFLIKLVWQSILQKTI